MWKLKTVEQLGTEMESLTLIEHEVKHVLPGTRTL